MRVESVRGTRLNRLSSLHSWYARLLARFDQLTALSKYNAVLKTMPVVKLNQWALEGNASMRQYGRFIPSNAMRYVSGIRQRLACVTDDLCHILQANERYPPR